MSDLRPEVSDRVDALVARMLAKDPEDRPRDGAAVAAEIAALGETAVVTGPSSEEPLRSSSRVVPALTGGEQRLLSVVLLGAPNPGEAAIAATISEMESRPPRSPCARWRSRGADASSCSRTARCW